MEGYLRPKAIGAEKGSSATGGFGESELVWVKDEQHGFVLCKIIEGGKAVAEEDGQTRDLAAYEKANPGRNDRAEDMAEMTELNEATVLHNLRRRYQSNLIYVHGDFLFRSFSLNKQSLCRPTRDCSWWPLIRTATCPSTRMPSWSGTGREAQVGPIGPHTSLRSRMNRIGPCWLHVLANRS